MKARLKLIALAMLALATLNSRLSTLRAQGTAFTYQGRLDVSGSVAGGLYDFRFKLYLDPLGNTQVGSTYLTNAIGVTNGLFTTTIDFGPGIFTGSNYWLEVDVRTNGVGSYTLLSVSIPGINAHPVCGFCQWREQSAGRAARDAVERHAAIGCILGRIRKRGQPDQCREHFQW